MAITRKPKPASGSAVNVDELIKRGGSPGGHAADSDGITAVVLRIPRTMLEQIDALVKAQPLKTPRHRWMLEALFEKLSREKHRGGLK